MKQNRIAELGPTHVGFTAMAIQAALRAISAQTGFIPSGELQRRTIYDDNKTWRVRIAGMYQGEPAQLRIENVELNTDEELIRQALRAQADGTNVRPPRTLQSEPFNAERGYAWSIDEAIGDEILFDPSGDPRTAAAVFCVFYRALRAAVREPFWPAPTHFFRTSPTPVITRSTLFTEEQLEKWSKLASDRDHELVVRHAALLVRLKRAMLRGVLRRPLQFMHPHLSGTDVRRTPDGSYVVFANYLWDWRQPGYDLAFPIWGQWLALPAERRTPEAVREITETWLTTIEHELADLADVRAVRTMLLNRIFGSLILDVPAQSERELPKSVAALEAALVAEAERLLV